MNIHWEFLDKQDLQKRSVERSTQEARFNDSTILEVPNPFSRGVTAEYIIFVYKETSITFGQDAYDFTAD